MSSTRRTHTSPHSLAHALSPSSPFRCAGFSVVEGFRLVGNDPNEDFLSWLVHESRPWRVILPAVYQTENVTFSADQHVPAFSKHGVPYPTGSTVRLALQGDTAPRFGKVLGYDSALGVYDMMVSSTPETSNGKMMQLSAASGHHRIFTVVHGKGVGPVEVPPHRAGASGVVPEPISRSRVSIPADVGMPSHTPR